MLMLIVRMRFFVRLNFRSCHRLRKYFYTENFQIYGNIMVILWSMTYCMPVCAQTASRDMIG